MNTDSSVVRTAVLDAVRLLGSAGDQLKYEADVPQASVVAELFEMFCTDQYHPKNNAFVNAFSEDELKDLALLYGYVIRASHRATSNNIDSVTDLQKTDEWRDVMSLAKNIHERLTRR